ncbi:hypothetical protein DPMN_114435 [Dreissena polymorpha]|uniref:Uncharacterized protein n=1 Tax=Dreissena polymorpha TaxID=45954 RepID=A0A9D4QSG5_DREPO|nr:hypothetical protein DPMN_114435 [Dreissena polymorpha]
MFSTENQTSQHPVQSFCFEFMADDATDAATMEQMALCHRFYDAEKACLERNSLGLSSASLPPTKLWLMPPSRTFKLLE